MVTEDVKGLEVVLGTIPELEAQELAGIGRRSAAELDGQRGAKVG